MKTKKILALLLAALLVLSFAACGGEKEPSGEGEGDKINLKLATGSTTGTYYAYGTAMAQLLSQKTGYGITVESTGASKANIQLMAQYQDYLAIVQNDVMSYAYTGTDLFDGAKITDFSAIGCLYAEVCQIVANPDAGISSIADLKGKRVSVGDAGSGVEFNAKQILAAYGITFDDIEKQSLGFGESADAFKNSQIDAFFCTAGAPTTAITDLTTSNKIVLLSVDDEHIAALQADYPFYAPYTIAAETYKGVAEAKTVAVQATLIVSNAVSEDAVYNLTKNLFENQADLAIAHAKGAELNTANAIGFVGDVPLHAGAQKYYTEIGAAK